MLFIQGRCFPKMLYRYKYFDKHFVFKNLYSPLRKAIYCLLVVFSLGLFDQVISKGLCKNSCTKIVNPAAVFLCRVNVFSIALGLIRENTAPQSIQNSTCCDENYVLIGNKKIYALLKNNSLLKERTVQSGLDLSLPRYPLIDEKPHHQQPLNITNYPAIISSVVLNC